VPAPPDAVRLDRLLRVNSMSATPPFEQVRGQLAAAIAAGRLTPGLRLPSVRQLADDLGLAVNTVARSYRELEAAGLVETRGRGGTVVLGGDPALERARAAAHDYADIARRSGLSVDDAVRLVRTALEAAGG
jgi:DNA-binding transcriptional regulator YhcF (GntR family)